MADSRASRNGGEVTLLDGSKLRAGSPCYAQVAFSVGAPLRWYAAKVAEVLEGGGVGRVRVELIHHTTSPRIVGRYRLKRRS